MFDVLVYLGWKGMVCQRCLQLIIWKRFVFLGCYKARVPMIFFLRVNKVMVSILASVLSFVFVLARLFLLLVLVLEPVLL